MLLRSLVLNEDSGPFRIIGQFCVCQNQPLYPCEFNSFSVLVRKQARARHVCYDDLMINWSLWILVSLNVFPLQRPELSSWVCSILVIIIRVRATLVIPKTTSQLNLCRDHQGHPTSIFCKVSVRKSKYCLEFTTLTWGRLKIPRWPFYSLIYEQFFDANLINSLRFSEFHISFPR